MPNCLCIARTAHPMYEIFVVQNWSQDKFSCRIAKNMENAENARGTCAWLKKCKNHHIARNIIMNSVLPSFVRYLSKQLENAF